jgi:hypothetical protein
LKRRSRCYPAQKKCAEECRLHFQVQVVNFYPPNFIKGHEELQCQVGAGRPPAHKSLANPASIRAGFGSCRLGNHVLQSRQLAAAWQQLGRGRAAGASCSGLSRSRTGTSSHGFNRAETLPVWIWWMPGFTLPQVTSWVRRVTLRLAVTPASHWQSRVRGSGPADPGLRQSP